MLTEGEISGLAWPRAKEEYMLGAGQGKRPSEAPTLVSLHQAASLMGSRTGVRPKPDLGAKVFVAFFCRKFLSHGIVGKKLSQFFVASFCRKDLCEKIVAIFCRKFLSHNFVAPYAG